MKTYKESQKEGKSSEDLFISLSNKKGIKIRKADSLQNTVEHWDVALEKNNKWYKVDIKARKRLYRSQKEPQDRFTIIELKGITGHPGWLYGKADFFAFERLDKFVMVRKTDLIDLVDEKLLTGIYEIRTRPNRQDKFFSLESRFVDEIKVAEWDK